MKFKILFVLIFCQWLVSEGNAKIPSIFGGPMALQRNKSIFLWERVNPGEKIKVSLSNLNLKVKANPDSTCKIQLPGGPHVLKVSGNRIGAF